MSDPIRYIAALLIFFCAIQAAGCSPLPSQTAGASKPQSWIDAPLNGSTIPLAPVDVVSHSSDPISIAKVQLSVNGTLIRTDPNGDTGATLVTMNQPWTPPGSGSYTLLVRAQNTAGVWGDYAQVVVTISGGGTVQGGIDKAATAMPTPAPKAETPTALPPVGTTFVADATTLALGQCTTLSWRVSNASQVFLDNSPITASGSKRDCPVQTTPHTLRVISLDGQIVQRTLTIIIVPPTRTFTPVPPTATSPAQVQFWADSTRLSPGQCTLLHWRTQNIQAIYLDGVGVTGNEDRQVCPRIATTYTLHVAYAGTSLDRQIVIVVISPNPPTPRPTPTYIVKP